MENLDRPAHLGMKSGRLFSVYVPVALAVGAGLDHFTRGGWASLAAGLLSVFVTAAFALEFGKRIHMTGSRYLRDRWFDSALTLILFLLVEERLRDALQGGATVGGPTPGYLTLFYALAATKLVTRTQRFFQWRETVELRPAQAALVGFALVILLGTIVLSLPGVTRNGVGLSLTDALFMSTSAVCVTGLIVVDPSTTFNLAGQIVLMLLIQVGGLGIITLGALLPMLILRRLDLHHELTLSENLGLPGIGTIRLVLLTVLMVTLGAEAIGTVALWGIWADDLGVRKGLYYALFHSISAFNNAGFSLFPDSLMRFVGDAPTHFIVTALVILGGLGFPVWVGVYHRIRKPRSADGLRPPMTLHVKVALWTTAVLILAAFVLFLPLEWNHSLRGLSWDEKLWAGWFQAVTPRTAGFNTIDTARISNPTRLIFMILMFIGGAPGGTAGGIKVTTSAVMFFAFRAYLGQKRDVVVFRRSILRDQIQKCIAIVFIGLALALVPTILLLVTENQPFDRVAFEAFSAFGTVGLSLGLTPELTVPGRYLIILLMFVGRLGPLTLALAFTPPAKTARIEYPEGKIMIG